MLPIKYYVYVLNNCVLTGHSCETSPLWHKLIVDEK